MVTTLLGSHMLGLGNVLTDMAMKWCCPFCRVHRSTLMLCQHGSRLHSLHRWVMPTIAVTV